MHDYSEFQDVEQEKTQLAKLHDAVESQTELEAKIASQKAELKESEQQLKTLTTRTIPDLMDILGMSEFTTRGGHKVAIKEIIRAAIPKKYLNEAIQWLFDNGHERLVKQDCVISFGREDESWARQFLGQMKRRKRPLNAVWKRGVHSQTLSAWAREKLSEGVDFPADLFGLFRQRVSKVDMPK